MSRLLLFTDIHWGKSNNSDMHNTYCNKVIDKIIELRDQYDFVYFLGDWFDTRNTINVKTMNLAYNALKRLSDFLHSTESYVSLIVGNHDCYSRNSREYHSMVQYKTFAGVNIIDKCGVDLICGKNIALVPYLFGDENSIIGEALIDYKADYAIGHFEIDGFVKEAEHIQKASMFKSLDRVLSGHFHNTSTKGNITYIGNPFQFDFGERDDDNKGLTIFNVERNTLDKIKLNDGFPLYIQGTKDEVIDKALQNNMRHLHLHIIVDRGTDVVELKDEIEKLNLPLHELKFTSIDNTIDEIVDIDSDNLLDIEALTLSFITNDMVLDNPNLRPKLIELFNSVAKGDE